MAERQSRPMKLTGMLALVGRYGQSCSDIPRLYQHLTSLQLVLPWVGGIDSEFELKMFMDGDLSQKLEKYL